MERRAVVDSGDDGPVSQKAFYVAGVERFGAGTDPPVPMYSGPHSAKLSGHGQI
jgi:hypothetical protein